MRSGILVPPLRKAAFSFFRKLQFAAAFAQGKGYGTASIEQEVNLVLRALSGVPKLAVDIGANVGDYTAELRRRNPQLEIHLFEPSATNIKKLGARFGNDPGIRMVPCAVSDKTGSATLFADAAGSGMASLSKRKLDHFGIGFEFQESVETLRFEDYWRQQLGGRRIDIAKLDIEGHELEALQGFGRALAATKVFQFEFGGCNIDSRTFFQDFWYFFAQNNCAIYRISPFGLEPLDRYRESDEYFSTTNYIAVNRQID